MPTRTTLTLVDRLAEEVRRLGREAFERLGAQAALVRAIVDEIGRRHPSDRQIPALHEQLGEELGRLTELAPAARHARLGLAESSVSVLVVDDDADTLAATMTVVRGCGYVCRGAASAEDALRDYERSPADIVVLDWNMPGMSGLDLFRALKLRHRLVYVLLVTAHEDARFLEGVRGGVDDFLSKPIDIDDLATRLAAAARLVQAVRALRCLTDALQN
jgi:CheY-like chemotaxis protein